MEVVAAAAATPSTNGGVATPFRDHDVREWSRIDGLTGALERARIETDRWSAETIGSSHKYGKVVDSLARTDPDGSIQHAAHRQLEIFHSQVPGGRLQVVKTHAVSKWTSNKTIVEQKDAFKAAKEFENLQLSLNTLDLSPQKSKASILRSVSRRPPTRQRPKEPPPAPEPDQSETLRSARLTAATNLHRVSRLCHQIHETAVRQAFGRKSTNDTINAIERRTNLRRTKSSSSDEIAEDPSTAQIRGTEDLEDLEQLQTWRRTSKLRRSLQFPNRKETKRPIDLPESGVSVRKIREELEKGRRLNTALRNNNVDLDALDQILQSITGGGGNENEDDYDPEDGTKRKQKKNSFVTVESIQEVKGRLRRTSSPSSDIYKTNGKDEDTDDGIVTEKSPSPGDQEMTSTTYKQGANGTTGSLESRLKLTNGSATRTEDWYNRRKSYGFERVHSQDESLNKNLVESSTDSGICRSTEIVVAPREQQQAGEGGEGARNGIQTGQVRKLASTFSQLERLSNGSKHHPDSWSKPPRAPDADWPELKSTTITIPIAKNNNVVDLTWHSEPNGKETKRHSIAVDESKYVTRTASEEKFRRTSLAFNDTDESVLNGRRPKRVEFCKTEVHFAADSGKVNIVATDEKPPPTQNFRRRRRNSGAGLEEFNKNGLPVLRFGDTTDEKSLFGTAEETATDEDGIVYENLVCRMPPAFGLVTVNTATNNRTELTEEEEKKELTESEIKGILKNKPAKPRPYHLGEEVLGVPDSSTASDPEDNKWGVRLRHVDSPPIWKSTVTVRNYYEGGSVQQPEFQKLLKNLRPTGTREEDPVEQDGEAQGTKGYSTKINFGEGQATVVQNERHPTWPRTEISNKDSKHLLNKGLVVRIGREDSALNHTVCSKMTTTQDPNSTTTTTTKITIDLSGKQRRSRSNGFKSTSLILETIKGRNDKTARQLEALKRLYEDVNSDSDADKEVQLLMSKDEEESEGDGDRGSVLSGSWSKMRAYKNISEHFSMVSVKEAKTRCDLKATTRGEKDLEKPIVQPSFQIFTRYSPSPPTKDFPSTPEKTPSTDLKAPDKLSSPFLVYKSNKTEETVVSKQLTEKRDGIVLRQPKKSEMTYFGVNVSPRPTRKKTPPKERAASPVYENLKPNKYSSKEIDSSILEELTKAADQILQAVNGYTDEDSRLEEEEESKQRAPLETIQEARSWKREPKVASSTEGSERSRSAKKGEQTKKARRLQRASSREALLQSHGSSSEDLPAKAAEPAPARRPRTVRKTKVDKLTVVNGPEMKKPSRKTKEEAGAKEERILGSLPEIRHKTAVSTIRSTSEKAARDRLKQRNEEIRRRNAPKKDSSKVSTSTGHSSEKERREATGTGRAPGGAAGRESGVTQHRISTANIKKCYRSDGTVRH